MQNQKTIFFALTRPLHPGTNLYGLVQVSVPIQLDIFAGFLDHICQILSSHKDVQLNEDKERNFTVILLFATMFQLMLMHRLVTHQPRN